MGCHQTFKSPFVTGLSAILLFLIIVSSARADLVLSAPPRETAEAGSKIYGALANYLTKELGVKVVYQHPGSWPYYQRGIRSDKYDIVFDGPHFMSWRMKKKGHEPVARLPGDLGFVLIAKADDNGIKVVKDLINQKICGISPPNLSTLTVLTRFGDVGQPILKSVKGGMGSVFNAFKKGECRGAILRNRFYNKKISDEDRVASKIIFSSEPVPNQGVTVSKRVSEDAKGKIIKILTEKNPGTTPLLKRFAPSVDAMSPVNAEEYKPYYELLSGVIVGW